MKAAVCYLASAGHLLQTALSAIQARGNVSPDVDVLVVFLSRGPVDDVEHAVFDDVLGRAGVEVIRADRSLLGDLSPMFGRLFLDRVLPDRVDSILYLDGDTQVLGDLSPLLEAEAPSGGLLAARDPMVLLSRVHPRYRFQISSWWDRSRISEITRGRYVNSGVFVLRRPDLVDLRRRVLAQVSTGLVFSDQDALNLVDDLRVGLVSMTWNFPGFLLGTPVEEVTPPRVVHFMSSPRPWQGPFRPWGARFFEPYRELVAAEPSLEPYWRPFSGASRLRYNAQQGYKAFTEHRRLSSSKTKRAAELLETDVVIGIAGDSGPWLQTHRANPTQEG